MGRIFEPGTEIITVWNAIISEYYHAKEMTQSPKFPELNLEKYVQALAVGIDQIKDSQRREHMRGLLSARGWKPQEVSSAPPPPPSVTAAAQDYPSEQQASQIEDFSVNAAIEFQSSKDALPSTRSCGDERQKE